MQRCNQTKPTNQNQQMIDLDEAEHVELQRDNTGKLWVNVNDKCVLRIGKTATLIVRATRKMVEWIQGEVAPLQLNEDEARKIHNALSVYQNFYHAMDNPVKAAELQPLMDRVRDEVIAQFPSGHPGATEEHKPAPMIERSWPRCKCKHLAQDHDDKGHCQIPECVCSVYRPQGVA